MRPMDVYIKKMSRLCEKVNLAGWIWDIFFLRTSPPRFQPRWLFRHSAPAHLFNSPRGNHSCFPGKWLPRVQMRETCVCVHRCCSQWCCVILSPRVAASATDPSVTLEEIWGWGCLIFTQEQSPCLAPGGLWIVARARRGNTHGGLKMAAKSQLAAMCHVRATRPHVTSQVKYIHNHVLPAPAVELAMRHV